MVKSPSPLNGHSGTTCSRLPKTNDQCLSLLIRSGECLVRVFGKFEYIRVLWVKWNLNTYGLCELNEIWLSKASFLDQIKLSRRDLKFSYQIQIFYQIKSSRRELKSPVKQNSQHTSIHIHFYIHLFKQKQNNT